MIFMINKIFLYAVKSFHHESIHGLLNNCSDIRGGDFGVTILVDKIPLFNAHVCADVNL